LSKARAAYPQPRSSTAKGFDLFLHQQGLDTFHQAAVGLRGV